MKKLLIVFVLVVGAGPAMPAPAPGDKPRFEYAVLQYTRGIQFPAQQPGAAPAQGVPFVTVKWTTSTDEIEGKDWSDLATKLKAPEAKKDATQLMQQLHVLDWLGKDGWEVYEHTESLRFGAATTWSLKRRVP